jgi:hypothetical protein
MQLKNHEWTLMNTNSRNDGWTQRGKAATKVESVNGKQGRGRGKGRGKGRGRG